MLACPFNLKNMQYDISNKQNVSILLKQMKDSDTAALSIYKNAPIVIKKINKINNEIIKDIFKKYGAISISQFGENTSHYAWLLIQHLGKQNIDVMEKYLQQMKNNSSDFNKRNIAYLEDRVNVYNKKPQRYGTQGYQTKDKKFWKFKPIVDIVNLDIYRNSMDLEPLSEYILLLQQDEKLKVLLPKGYMRNN